MELVLNNPDLIRHIYSFGNVSHRENMKNLENEIILYTKEKWRGIIKDFIKENVDIYFWKEDVYSRLCNYIYTIFSKKDCIKIIKLCNRCKCCDKHILNKPVIIDKFAYKAIEKKVYCDESFCDCQCRRFSRSAFRALLCHTS